jgi:hypothetical protein
MATGNQEHHRTDRIGWLRAAVLGANDGTWLGGEVGGGLLRPLSSFCRNWADIALRSAHGASAPDATLPLESMAHVLSIAIARRKRTD